MSNEEALRSSLLFVAYSNIYPDELAFGRLISHREQISSIWPILVLFAEELRLLADEYCGTVALDMRALRETLNSGTGDPREMADVVASMAGFRATSDPDTWVLGDGHHATSRIVLPEGWGRDIVEDIAALFPDGANSPAKSLHRAVPADSQPGVGMPPSIHQFP